MYGRFVAFLTLFASFSAVALPSEGPAADVVVEEAWVIPSGATVASLYLVINNRGDAQVVLEAVSSPLAQSMRLMRPSGEEFPRGAVIPIHSELYMQPGGVYVALDGLQGPLVEGQVIPLTVRLGSGKSAQLSAVVLAADASPPDHHDYVHP